MTELKKINIEVSRKDAFEMFNCLDLISKLKLSVYIKFDVGHNKNKLKENFELIQDIISNNDDIEGFADYKKTAQEIASEYTKYFKDGTLDDPEKAVELNQKLTEHKNANPKVIEAVEQKQKDLDEKTKEMVPINGLIMLKLENFPKETELDFSPIISLIER